MARNDSIVKMRELLVKRRDGITRSPPKKKHDAFARLSHADQLTVQRLSAILRLADGMDRSHTRCIKKVDCQVRGQLVHVAMLSDRRTFTTPVTALIESEQVTAE